MVWDVFAYLNMDYTINRIYDVNDYYKMRSVSMDEHYIVVIYDDEDNDHLVITADNKQEVVTIINGMSVGRSVKSLFSYDHVNNKFIECVLELNEHGFVVKMK